MATKRRLKVEPAPIGEKLLTLREAAGVLRMNPRTLRAYLRRGEIEGRVIGGKYRFRRIDLDRFFEDAPVTGIFAERLITGIRWWNTGKERPASSQVAVGIITTTWGYELLRRNATEIDLTLFGKPDPNSCQTQLGAAAHACPRITGDRPHRAMVNLSAIPFRSHRLMAFVVRLITTICFKSGTLSTFKKVFGPGILTEARGFEDCGYGSSAPPELQTG
jgi:excisionase family DNA binding protein